MMSGSSSTPWTCDYQVEKPNSLSRTGVRLGSLPPAHGNAIDLLINGKATFKSLFKAIDRARDYILVNFFIVKNDRVGTAFKDALIRKARAGVRVYFLFDEIGSHKLARSYLREMREAGIVYSSFGTNRYWWSRFQLNFRNHRKIVVVDGREAFLGGLNVGDEYLGMSARFGAWRDTHLAIRGPAVQAVQLAFLEDWFWAADDVPAVSADIVPDVRNQELQILPTGPADPQDSWQLFVIEAANLARERLWITSPYFVPDTGALSALQAAALRGVDVRILLPEKADHLLVYLSSFSFYEATMPVRVKLYRYTAGFLHQKVLLSDKQAAVGTANLDNRSFRLNFEITAFSTDPTFVREVEGMLEKDFAQARPATLDDFRSRSFMFRAACRAARLLANPPNIDGRQGTHRPRTHGKDRVALQATRLHLPIRRTLRGPQRLLGLRPAGCRAQEEPQGILVAQECPGTRRHRGHGRGDSDDGGCAGLLRAHRGILRPHVHLQGVQEAHSFRPVARASR